MFQMLYLPYSPSTYYLAVSTVAIVACPLVCFYVHVVSTTVLGSTKHPTDTVDAHLTVHQNLNPLSGSDIIKIDAYILWL